jgi:glyoxylase-like metal-dependent hydrolase (beta-lactamase superfamily II)
MRTPLLIIAGLAAAAAAAPPALAPGIHLVAGGIEPGRQPDGNSVLFEAPQGLVVVDTGRHRWHREKIEQLAARLDRPIVAIVNTHWHLDHISGNLALKAAYPRARVHASDAIDGALTGFLADSARGARAALAGGKLDPTTVEEIEGDLATFDQGSRLRPDVVVRRSGPVALGGRRFDLRLSPNAATAGDVWLYDRARRVAVVGDLVTLPVPFLDTACPEGWRRALGEVAAVPFATLVPGHGAPMTRAQFGIYRAAFGALLDCAAGKAEAAACADGWVRDAGPLLGGDARETARARRMASYYVGSLLRANAGKSKYCPR